MQKLTPAKIQELCQQYYEDMLGKYNEERYPDNEPVLTTQTAFVDSKTTTIGRCNVCGHIWQVEASRSSSHESQDTPCATCPACGARLYWHRPNKQHMLPPVIAEDHVIFGSYLDMYSTVPNDPEKSFFPAEIRAKYSQLDRRVVYTPTLRTKIGLFVKNAGLYIYDLEYNYRNEPHLTQPGHKTFPNAAKSLFVTHSERYRYWNSFTVPSVDDIKETDNVDQFIDFLNKSAEEAGLTARIDPKAIRAAQIEKICTELTTIYQQQKIAAKNASKKTDELQMYADFHPSVSLDDLIKPTIDKHQNALHTAFVTEHIGDYRKIRLYCPVHDAFTTIETFTNEAYHQEAIPCPICHNAMDFTLAVAENVGNRQYIHSLHTSPTVKHTVLKSIYYDKGPMDSLCIRFINVYWTIDLQNGRHPAAAYEYRIFITKKGVIAAFPNIGSVKDDDPSGYSSSTRLNESKIWNMLYDPNGDPNRPVTYDTAMMGDYIVSTSLKDIASVIPDDISCNGYYKTTRMLLQSNEEIANVIMTTQMRTAGIIEAYGLAPGYRAISDIDGFSDDDYIWRRYKRPLMEQLVKIHMDKLATDIKDVSLATLRANGINPAKSTIQEAIGITKRGLNFLRERNASINEAIIVAHALRQDPDLKDELIGYICEHLKKSYFDSNTIKDFFEKYQTINDAYGIPFSRFAEYLKNVYDFQCIPTSEAITIWTDYIRMCKLMDIRLDKSGKYPSSLKREHDKMTFAYNAIAKDKNDELFEKIACANRDKYAYVPENDEHGEPKFNYQVVAPMTSADVINEGRDLHHCVGSYVKRITDGETVIMFIRESDRLDTSFFTMEIYRNTIVQVHGMSNKRPSGSALIRFIRHYAKVKGLRISSIF